MSRRVLILAAALVLVLAPPAEAGGVVGVISAVTTWFANLSPFTQAALRIAVAVAVSAATAPRLPKPGDLKRELPRRTALPSKRTVYGYVRTTGTPAPWHVKGRVLYGCILFNSRPSAGSNLSLTVDGRRCAIFSGDISDFSGPGAKIEILENFPDWDSAEDQFHCWLGLGDQTTCPDRIVSEAGGHFLATDAWRGQTVLWVRMSAGGSAEKRPKRWPSVEPIVQLEMDWSRVWDPRDGGQDPDDPSTWTYSDNQALCLLDALRTNPIRSYDGRIDMDGFDDGIALADEDVLLWHATQTAGSDQFQKRYCVGAVIDWTTGELMDLIKPLADAGAGELFRVGGRIGYAPGGWRPPTYTETDILGDSGVEYVPFQSERQAPYALRGQWTSQERQWEEAELSPVLVTNGDTNTDNIRDLPLPAVTNGFQAQRVTTIEANRLSLQKTLSCVLPPRAIQLTFGSNITMDLVDGWDRLNGVWQVRSAAPAAWLTDRDLKKVAFQNPVTLREEAASIYAWDPETQEADVPVVDLPAVAPTPAPISDLTLEIIYEDNAGAALPYVMASFSPVDDADRYEISARSASGEPWVTIVIAGDAEVDGSGNLVARFGPVIFDETYEVSATYDTATASADPATDSILVGYALALVSATPLPGALSVDFTPPGVTPIGTVRLYRAAVGDVFANAVQVGQSISVAPSVAQTAIFGDEDATDVVTNGDFADATGWTTPGGWAIAGGVAAHTANGANNVLSRAATLVAGANYRVTHTILNHTAGGGFARLIGATNVNGTNRSADGTYTEILTAPAAPTAVGYLCGTATTHDIDDLSVVEDTATCLPHGAADFWVVPVTTTGAAGTPTALGTQLIR